MTDLEQLTERSLAEARRELEQTGQITPLFLARYPDGSIQKATLPGNMGVLMDSDAGKDLLFAGVRRIVRASGITAVATLVDAWLSRTTPKGLELMQRDRQEFDRQTNQHKCAEAVRNGLMERREAIVVTTQDAEHVVVTNQFYLRGPGTVTFDEREHHEFPQAQFKGRMKFYGEPDAETETA
jgi:hypothetical protein